MKNEIQNEYTLKELEEMANTEIIYNEDGSKSSSARWFYDDYNDKIKGIKSDHENKLDLNNQLKDEILNTNNVRYYSSFDEIIDLSLKMSKKAEDLIEKVEVEDRLKFLIESKKHKSDAREVARIVGIKKRRQGVSNNVDIARYSKVQLSKSVKLAQSFLEEGDYKTPFAIMANLMSNSSEPLFVDYFNEIKSGIIKETRDKVIGSITKDPKIDFNSKVEQIDYLVHSIAPEYFNENVKKKARELYDNIKQEEIMEKTNMGLEQRLVDGVITKFHIEKNELYKRTEKIKEKLNKTRISYLTRKENLDDEVELLEKDFVGRGKLKLLNVLSAVLPSFDEYGKITNLIDKFDERIGRVDNYYKRALKDLNQTEEVMKQNVLDRNITKDQYNSIKNFKPMEQNVLDRNITKDQYNIIKNFKPMDGCDE